MLRHRLATAIIGLPVFIASFYYGGLFWTAVVLLLTTVGTFESTRLVGNTTRSARIFAVVGAYALIAAAYHFTVGKDPWISGIGATVVAVIMVAALIYVYTQVGRRHWLGTVIAATLYPGLFFCSFIALRATGFEWLLLAAVITWVTDTAAYFVGGRWGKRRLWPQVSPNKTVEGALGGWVLGTACGSLMAWILSADIVAWTWIAAFASAIAQIGDLYESALKRRSGVKDSGAILPGHGGILDRFDSLLLSTSAVYLLQHVLR